MANKIVLVGDQKINGTGTQGHQGWFTGDTLINPDGVPIMIAPGIAEGTFADGDTTPDVSAATDWLTANTGATTITALDGGVAGHRVRLRIGDVNTIISGALTKTGNAIVCQVGDSFEWFYDGASWHQCGGNVGMGGTYVFVNGAAIVGWIDPTITVATQVDLSLTGVRKGACIAHLNFLFQLSGAPLIGLYILPKQTGSANYIGPIQNIGVGVWPQAFVALDGNASFKAYFSNNWLAVMTQNTALCCGYWI